jgi:hypothetical protein
VRKGQSWSPGLCGRAGIAVHRLVQGTPTSNALCRALEGCDFGGGCGGVVFMEPGLGCDVCGWLKNMKAMYSS